MIEFGEATKRGNRSEIVSELLPTSQKDLILLRVIEGCRKCPKNNYNNLRRPCQPLVYARDLIDEKGIPGIKRDSLSVVVVSRGYTGDAGCRLVQQKSI